MAEMLERYAKAATKAEKKLPLLPRFVESFYDKKIAEDIKPSTLLGYIEDIENFFKWLCAESIVSSPTYHEITISMLDKLEESDFDRYKRFLLTQKVQNELAKKKKIGLAKVTVNRKLSSLKMLFNYLYKAGDISNNPLFDYKMFEIKKTPSQRAHEIMEKILPTDDDITDFLDFVRQGYKNQIEGNKQAYGHYIKNRERDIAIISLFLGSGIRLVELLELTLDKVDLNERKLKIVRKGDKADVIYFTKLAHQDLIQYLRIRNERYNCDSDTEHVFISAYKGTTSPIKRRTVQSIIEKYMAVYSQDTSRSLSPHKLRHSFASLMARKGNDITIIQQQLGHSDPSVTRQYIHVNSEQMKNAIDSL
ncbi:tyrosine recombinase XerS [Bacillus sp. HMF5848]|uniref:tyrosine recombinase XerS n=1 Tax=Bacillus sp. HMF5848 TaxID=2495421 RepID=UPI000F79E007|nr:tyrosine recombinase XerS [Bacillus sp. HMF5848]RSK27170.1 tyrosine recombinase XerS [Bacillus sp. HMF5848]